eukprot:TRINITY_DN9472_c0_g1_i1.p1 TRINITY_DN9472_c0_g1~~TRINITY_DN9472_c0_g1_i1.p1  ORF type:complete len:172 (-),score=43.18 TRINITY_DN9472_c0_g1_i1:68-583(-)
MSTLPPVQYQQPNVTYRPGSDSQEAMVIFSMIDTDKNGFLSWEEIYCNLHDLGFSDPNIEEFFLSVDQDHSGTVDSQEFCAAYARYKHYFQRLVNAPPQQQKQKLDLWYRCPCCAQLVVNNTGSEKFACPHCTCVMQSVPSKKPLIVQQTTVCTNAACKQSLIVPADGNGN